MNNMYNYNLLMAKRINMINQNLNERDIRKLSLSLDLIRKKRKKKLNIKELDELKEIIKKLQKIPKDERFQDYILRTLKAFLIYGNVKLINKSNIILNLNKTVLYISIDNEYITSILQGEDYKEEITWHLLDNDYYTNYLKKETNISKDKNIKYYEINTTKEFHGFHNNKEIITRLISEADNYEENMTTKEINRKKAAEENYKEVTSYYRKDGFIIKNKKKKYKVKNISKYLDYNEYKISEDYHKNEKYLNPNGLYQKITNKLYNSMLKEKHNIKSLYKQTNGGKK